MDIEAAIALVDHLLGTSGLSDLQEQIFRRVWAKEKYPEIAEALGYDPNYIKDLGAKLWKEISQALGEKVTKSNLQSVLRRHQSSYPLPAPSITSSAQLTGKPAINWGDQIDTENFVGREKELEALNRWIQAERRPLTTITGIAGIGKTTLAAQFVQQHHDAFDCVIWRSLKHPKRLPELINDLLAGLQILPSGGLPEEQTAHLIQSLTDQHCLIILDGFESLFHGAETQDSYSPDHEDYHRFFQQIATAQHHSSVIVTSREDPQSWIYLRTTGDIVKSLRLNPFPAHTAQQLLAQQGHFSGSEEDWAALTEQYGGNPLALQIVSTNILDFFQGNITEFLAEGQIVFKGLSAFLQQQWSVLTADEQWVLYYLAIRREAVSFKAIKSDLLDLSIQRHLTEILATLVRRSLIQKQDAMFSLQTAVAEYATFQLTKNIAHDIFEHQTHLLSQLPLLKNNSRNYLQNGQKQFILHPILNQLKSQLPSDQSVRSHLEALLDQCKSSDYAAGNLLNLLLQLKIPLHERELSGLTLWEVNLSAQSLHQVNLQACDLSRTEFSHAFSGVTSAAFSPDGEQFITGHENGMLYQWSEAGQQLLEFDGHTSWVWDLCWTPNAQFIISVSEDQSLRVWHVQSGECRLHLTGHDERIWQVICPTDDLAISCSSDQTIKVWDISNGLCLMTLSGHEGDITSLALGANGEFFSGSTDQTIKCWNYLSGEPLKSWTHPSGGVWALTYNASTETLYSGGDNGVIAGWKRDKSEPVHILQYQTQRIWTMALSPCHQYLMAGGEGKVLLRWNLIKNKVDRVIPGYEGRIWSVTYNPSGEKVLTASDDNKVHLWNIESNHSLLTLNSYSNWACDVTFLPSTLHQPSDRAVSAHEDGHIYLWVSSQDTPIQSFQGHQQSIWAIANHPAGTHLVSGSDDYTLRIWEVESGHCQSILRGHQRPIWSVAWSPDGESIVSGSGDRTIKLWNPISGECVHTLLGHQSRIWSVAISPDNQQIASGSGDRSIKLWDRRTGECSDTLTEHDSQVLALDYHPQNSNRLASAGGNGICKLWDLDQRSCDTITVPARRLWSLAWSPNGKLLALGGDNGVIYIWSQQQQTITSQISTHAGCIWAIAFTSDSTQLCSSSQDGQVSFWDVTTGAKAHHFQPKRLYEGLNLIDARGLTSAQLNSLERLGAKV